MSTPNGRPAYDAGTPADGFPSLRDLMAPRVRRTYTQGAKGEWRAEFTVESHRDPLTEDGASDIDEEDEVVATIVARRLATLNGGTPGTG